MGERREAGRGEGRERERGERGGRWGGGGGKAEAEKAQWLECRTRVKAINKYNNNNKAVSLRPHAWCARNTAAS